MLPTTQEYKISLMIGQDSFRTLEGVKVIPNPNYPDEPWYSTGGLAIVFKLKLKDKLYALKCFYTEANERQERLGLIAEYLKQNPSPYFVDFTYLEDELWVESDNDEGQGYPVVLMEWVEGKTLDNYLEQICSQNNTPALKNLYFQFCNLAWWLQQQPIAHGDIKHDNLIVMPDGKLKLIDYDGVFVPALRGRKANEMGSPCYQHPKRDAHFFDKNLDDFSLLVLQITLLALQQEPKFFTEHYNGDGIILKDTDYQNFVQSPIKTILWQLPKVKIPLLLSQLQGNLNNLSTIDLMPLLQDVAWINWLVGGQKDCKLEFERQRLKELVLGDERWRKLFIEVISLNYSLNERLIGKYKDKWFWNLISINKSLPWSVELIEKYEDKWDWKGLSRNESLPWSVEFIEKYEDKWDWERSGGYRSSDDQLGISGNNSVPWSIELIEKYRNWWEWGKLSRNTSLPWSIELIEKYEDKWWWGSITSFYHFSGNLSCNNSLPWSIILIEKFEDKWNWGCLSINESLPWSTALIEKYEGKWDWVYLSRNKALPWSFKLVEKYSHKWDWRNLSENISLPWSTELIEKYEDKWAWGFSDGNIFSDGSDYLIGGMSGNNSLPWSIELIEKYEDKWWWEPLSENESLPWSIELIEKYEDKWTWGSWEISFDGSEYPIKGMSGNNSLPWSIELIEKYEDEWWWHMLSKKESLPWSVKLIEKFIKLDWSNFFYPVENIAIYEKAFQPLLSDEFIDEVMSEICGRFIL